MFPWCNDAACCTVTESGATAEIHGGESKVLTDVVRQLLWYNNPMRSRIAKILIGTGLTLAVMVGTLAALPALEVEAPTYPPNAVTIPARPTVLQRDLVTLRETYHLPAIEACVIRADGIVDTAVTGVRKVGGTKSVTTSDLFHLGSMTKAMTATMLATLVQEGKLSWNMTMVQTFPSWAAVMDSRYRDVTLEQLLTHTSGLPRYTTDPEWESIPPFTGTPAQQREAFARMPLTTPPIGPAASIATPMQDMLLRQPLPSG